MTLDSAKIGNFYRIMAVDSEGNQLRRLLDMGFTKGRKIYIEAIAPFKGTILVELRGFRVALREDVARLIEIQPFFHLVDKECR